MSNQTTSTSIPQLEFLGLDQFRSSIGEFGGPARSERFIVRLSLGSSSLLRSLGYGDRWAQDLQYLCESASLPGRGFHVEQVRYYGPLQNFPVRTEYDSVNTIDLTFITRNNGLERQFFDDWMEVINPTTNFDFAYRNQYAVDMYVYQFSELPKKQFKGYFETEETKPSPPKNPEAVYEWTFRDTYPILIHPQEVSWGSPGILKLTISMTYSKWTRRFRNIPPESFGHLVQVPGSITVPDPY